MGLPLPRVVSDVGPGGRLFTNVNAVNKEGLERRKQELENQYYGPTALANAMSKMAYANVAFPDALAKFAQSPAGQMMSSTERTNLNKLFQSYVNNIPNGMNTFQQMAQQNQRGTGLLGMLLNGIQGAISGQNALIPQQMQQQMTPSPAASAPTPVMPVSPPPGGPEGTYKKVGGAKEFVPPGADEEMPVATGAVGVTPAAGIGPATPAGNQAAALNIPDTQGGLTPELGAKVQETQATTAAQGQTQDEVKMMTASKTNAENLSALAPQLEKLTDEFETNYDQSYYKGAKKGSVHSSGLMSGPSLIGNDLTPEQLTDTSAEQAANLIANWLNSGGGHVNDSLREQAKSIKGFSRSLDEGAKRVIVDQTRAFTDRGSEYADFVPFVTRNNPNITSVEMNQLFNKYQRYFPNYDYKNNKPNHQNDDLWRVFASPEALTIYRTTGNFKPTDVKKMPDGRIFFKINGRLFVE